MTGYIFKYERRSEKIREGRKAGNDVEGTLHRPMILQIAMSKTGDTPRLPCRDHRGAHVYAPTLIPGLLEIFNQGPIRTAQIQEPGGRQQEPANPVHPPTSVPLPNVCIAR